MAGPAPRRIARLALATILACLAFGAVATSPSVPSAEAISRWTGGIDLYRSGVFTTQKSWLWCTAADVQIMRNIVHHQADHSSTNQSRYFSYMRAHDHYWMPVSDGTEPSGWTAGLRQYVDSRYRLVQSTSFDSALRSAVTNLRKTNLPVGLLVAHGDHAWILTGFTATADPAKTSHFTVTSVRVVGPLWGLQNRTYGYDMPPDKRLTPSQLRGFFTPWHYARVRMAWEGKWVSIQGIPTASTSSTISKATSVHAKPDPKPAVKPHATHAPKPRPTPKPAPATAPSPSASTEAIDSAVPEGVALVDPTTVPLTSGSPAPVDVAQATSSAVTTTPPANPLGWVLPVILGVTAIAFAAIVVLGVRRVTRV